MEESGPGKAQAAGCEARSAGKLNCERTQSGVSERVERAGEQRSTTLEERSTTNATNGSESASERAAGMTSGYARNGAGTGMERRELSKRSTGAGDEALVAR